MSYRQKFCCIKMSYREIRTRTFLLKAPLKKSYKTSIWFFRFIFLLCLSIMTFIYLWVKNKEFLFGRVVCLLWQRKHQLKKYNKNFHIPFFLFQKRKIWILVLIFWNSAYRKKVSNKSLLPRFPRNWLYKPLCPSRNKVSIDQYCPIKKLIQLSSYHFMGPIL